MCGIAGVVGTGDTSAIAARMADALAHRGPDDSGAEDLCDLRDARLGTFSHRRLAIIDLSSAGHQPMFSANGRLALTYNGEIYNYAELKRELEAEGITFRSSSDTEVLLAGWLAHGKQFLGKLRGMFAFALWDRDTARCYLVRDAFGIKPLYVAARDGKVLFASEVRAILASGVIDPVLSSTAVASYLFTGSVAEPHTIIEGVTAVPAGSVVEVDVSNGAAASKAPEVYFDRLLTSEDLDVDPACHVHRVRNALRQSVAYHLVSDVPVAVFLSGGIDSSAVAGLAAEISSTQLSSFTVTFHETDYSEANPARETARRFGTRHHEILLSSDDLLAALPDAFSAMDQPSLDGLNTFVVSRAVRAYDIKVVLSGLGGDELFGGYPSFRRARIASALWRIPRPLRRAAAAGSRPLGDLRAERMRSVMDESTPAFAAYRASRTLFGERQLYDLTGVRYPGGVGMPRPGGADISGLPIMQQVSIHELTGYMRNTLLRDSDVFSMAHSLELRVPMVDVGVARAAAAASAAIGRNSSNAKPVLVEAVRDLLSEETLNRPKKGFTLPFETWMRDRMSREIDSVLTSAAAKSVGLRGDGVSQVWAQFLSRRPGVNWSRPWALYTLLRWAQLNGVSAST